MPQPFRSRQFLSTTGGFTLLEMLVVIAVIGLVAGIALPNFARMFDRFSISTQWREAEAQIDSMPYRAFQEGRVLVLTNNSAFALLSPLPEGWQVRVEGEIRYRDNGWCEGGRLALIAADGVRRDYSLAAPRCAIRAS